METICSKIDLTLVQKILSQGSEQTHCQALWGLCDYLLYTLGVARDR